MAAACGLECQTAIGIVGFGIGFACGVVGLVSTMIFNTPNTNTTGIDLLASSPVSSLACPSGLPYDFIIPPLPTKTVTQLATKTVVVDSPLDESKIVRGLVTNAHKVINEAMSRGFAQSLRKRVDDAELVALWFAFFVVVCLLALLFLAVFPRVRVVASKARPGESEDSQEQMMKLLKSHISDIERAMDAVLTSNAALATRKELRAAIDSMASLSAPSAPSSPPLPPRRRRRQPPSLFVEQACPSTDFIYVEYGVQTDEMAGTAATMVDAGVQTVDMAGTTSAMIEDVEVVDSEEDPAKEVDTLPSPTTTSPSLSPPLSPLLVAPATEQLPPLPSIPGRKLATCFSRKIRGAKATKVASAPSVFANVTLQQPSTEAEIQPQAVKEIIDDIQFPLPATETPTEPAPASSDQDEAIVTESSENNLPPALPSHVVEQVPAVSETELVLEPESVPVPEPVIPEESSITQATSAAFLPRIQHSATSSEHSFGLNDPAASAGSPPDEPQEANADNLDEFGFAPVIASSTTIVPQAVDNVPVEEFSGTSNDYDIQIDLDGDEDFGEFAPMGLGSDDGDFNPPAVVEDNPTKEAQDLSEEQGDVSIEENDKGEQDDNQPAPAVHQGGYQYLEDIAEDMEESHEVPDNANTDHFAHAADQNDSFGITDEFAAEFERNFQEPSASQLEPAVEQTESSVKSPTSAEKLQPLSIDIDFTSGGLRAFDGNAFSFTKPAAKPVESKQESAHTESSPNSAVSLINESEHGVRIITPTPPAAAVFVAAASEHGVPTTTPTAPTPTMSVVVSSEHEVPIDTKAAATTVVSVDTASEPGVPVMTSTGPPRATEVASTLDPDTNPAPVDLTRCHKEINPSIWDVDYKNLSRPAVAEQILTNYRNVNKLVFGMIQQQLGNEELDKIDASYESMRSRFLENDGAVCKWKNVPTLKKLLGRKIGTHYESLQEPRNRAELQRFSPWADDRLAKLAVKQGENAAVLAFRERLAGVRSSVAVRTINEFNADIKQLFEDIGKALKEYGIE